MDSGLSTSLWTVQWTVQWTVLLCGLIGDHRRRAQQMAGMHALACSGSIHIAKQLLRNASRTCARCALPPNPQQHLSSCQTALSGCKLLAALNGDPARRGFRSVGRLAEHARSAHGASRLVARRPRRGGRARSVLHARVRPCWDYGVRSDLPADCPRVRARSDLADRRRSF